MQANLTVALNKKRMRWILIYFLLMILFTIIVLVLSFRFNDNNRSFIEALPLIFGLLFFCGIPFWMLYKIYKLKEKWQAMLFVKDDIIYNHTSVFKRQRVIPIHAISQIMILEKSFFLRQIVIFMNAKGEGGNVLQNQLTGRTIYITDYFLNRKQFKVFAKNLIEEISNK